MMTTNKLGLYIHIPFCRKKCRYCDFLSFSVRNEGLYSEYVSYLQKELVMKSEQWPYRKVDSIYIGGGTPSLLDVRDVAAVMDCLHDNYNITADAEITIEANPATLTDDKLDTYLEKGINRLSIGVQSFDNHVLDILGRIHDKNDALHAFQRAKRAGFTNINLDAMFGIPGQNMKKWVDTMKECIFLGPSHISLYSLQIEEGTEFYRMMYEEGRMKPLPEETDRKMYHTALRMMKNAGYEHYEISNAALPGYRSRHNMKYWSYEEYLGLGLGASSFVGGRRFKNYNDIHDYFASLDSKADPMDEETIEDYTVRDEMGIFMFTGLRKTEGIYFEDFRKIFRKDLFECYDRNIMNKYRGLLMTDGRRLYLSEKGMDVSNRIMMEFI